jgi:DNA gyrase subunit B
MTKLHKKKKVRYDADQIQVLGDVNAIRKRPSMYVEDLGMAGYHQLIKEIVDNSIDEWVAGNATTIQVTLNTAKQIIQIRDDGRGIPVGLKKELGISALTVVFTKTHAGAKFEDGAYDGGTSGLHGVGATATAALSEYLQVWTEQRGKVYTQIFEQGVPSSEVVVAKKVRLKRGTVVRFRPDRTIFTDSKVHFDPKRIAARLEELSYLCPGLKLVLTVDDQEPMSWQSSAGLGDLLSRELKEVETLHEPIVHKSRALDFALVWTKEVEGERWRSFANTVSTAQHGTHVDGLKKAISRAFAHNDVVKKEKLRGEDLRDGLVVLVHAKLKEPQFRGNTKARLSNTEVVDQVSHVATPILKRWVDSNVAVVKSLVAKATELRNEKQRFRAKQQAIKGVKVKAGARGILPEKLTEAPECDASIRELYLVEGDSAGGLVSQARVKTLFGRDQKPVHFQETLKLRGKGLNVAKKSDFDKILANKEVISIVQSIGAGVGDDFNLAKCRHRGIYILSDADPDGKHICALLLAFFARYMTPLIEDGRLYVVLAPLFMGVSATQRVYGNSMKAVKAQLKQKANCRIARFKGLGESDPNDLRAYALAPETRRVMKVVWGGVKDGKSALRFMGNDVAVRKALLGLQE